MECGAETELEEESFRYLYPSHHVVVDELLDLVVEVAQSDVALFQLDAVQLDYGGLLAKILPR